MGNTEFEYYEQQFIELRERLVRVLGAPTVNRLIERAVSEISRAHPGMSSLRSDDDGLVLNGVRNDMASASPQALRDGFMALAAVLLLLVARLLGREIASRLTEGVSIADILESEVPLGR